MLGDANALPKPKRSMLPLLTVLFLISYGLLTLLVVEQNETIQVQRGLLRQLFGDSIELSAMKVRINRQKNDAQSHPQSPASPVTPGDNANSKRNGGGKTHRSAPQKPPKPTSDTNDERRALITI